MAKRSGKSSNTGGANALNRSEVYGNPETSGHLHEDEFGYYSSEEQRLEWLQKDYGMDEKTAQLTEEALYSFTGGGYTSIRNAYEQGKVGTSAYEKAERLENLIQAGPKYNGDIYRGISVGHKEADKIISTLQNGGRITMQGVASWSSDIDIASDFANETSSNTSLVSIVFRNFGGTKVGTSIQHFSQFGKGEHEVLCSAKAQYGAHNIIKSVNESGRTVYYVDVDEYLG